MNEAFVAQIAAAAQSPWQPREHFLVGCGETQARTDWDLGAESSLGNTDERFVFFFSEDATEVLFCLFF